MHSHQLCGMLEHVSDECDDVEASECCCIALVILDQPAAACGPGKGSFHNPSPWQQDKTPLCLWQFDDVQGDALGCYGVCGCLAGVALIDIGEFDTVTCCILDIGGKAFHRGTVTGVGRYDVQGEKVAERVHGHMHLRPALAFGTVVLSVEYIREDTLSLERATGSGNCHHSPPVLMKVPKVLDGELRS